MKKWDIRPHGHKVWRSLEVYWDSNPEEVKIVQLYNLDDLFSSEAKLNN
jgi:hypothetical protein